MAFEIRSPFRGSGGAELRSAWTAGGGCPYADLGLDGRGRPSLHRQFYCCAKMMDAFGFGSCPHPSSENLVSRKPDLSWCNRKCQERRSRNSGSREQSARSSRCRDSAACNLDSLRPAVTPAGLAASYRVPLTHVAVHVPVFTQVNSRLAAIGSTPVLPLLVVAAANVLGNAEPGNQRLVFPCGVIVPVITDELD